MFASNLRGEMSNEQVKTEKSSMNLIDVLGNSLGLSSKREVMELSNIIFPALVTNAVVKLDYAQLNTLKSCVSVHDISFVYFVEICHHG